MAYSDSTWHAYRGDPGKHSIHLPDSTHVANDPTSATFVFVGPGVVTYTRHGDGRITFQHTTARRVHGERHPR